MLYLNYMHLVRSELNVEENNYLQVNQFSGQPIVHDIMKHS